MYKIFRGRMLPLGVPYHEYPASVPGNDYIYSLPSITVLTFVRSEMPSNVKLKKQTNKQVISNPTPKYFLPEISA